MACLSPACGLPVPFLWPARGVPVLRGLPVVCLCPVLPLGCLGPACLWAARALLAVCRAVAECTELFLHCTAVCCTVLECAELLLHCTAE